MRDPVHGDIEISRVEAAVMDTRVFQRLRYIRQNGLLHFIFPGAVHTRFSHSVGTMSIAGRAFDRIFHDARAGARVEERRAIEYVREVFRLAALLHDVGHCAFSHSIERVFVDGKPLLGSTRRLFEDWRKADLLARYLRVEPGAADEPVTHEQIGLILVEEIFSQDRVAAACGAELRNPPTDVATDVQAVMNGGLPPSESFLAAAERAFDAVARVASPAALFGGTEQNRFATDLLSILHTLVSGTLDVDRLDYLIRDSLHCGVPYGRCDVQILVNSLSIGPLRGETVLLLSEKASYALDDMLWSRYQLFIQVLNHKTNVGLNAVLSKAIGDAVGDNVLRAPRDLTDYVGFTDDHVMSTVFRACLYGGRLAERSYAKALVDRRVPFQVYAGATEETPDSLRKEYAAKLRCAEDEVFAAEARSEFIKGGPLPLVVGWDRRSGKRTLRPFRDGSSAGAIPVVLRKVHVFVDRDVAERMKGAPRGKA